MRDLGQLPSMIAAIGVVVVAGLLVYQQFGTDNPGEAYDPQMFRLRTGMGYRQAVIG